MIECLGYLSDTLSGNLTVSDPTTETVVMESLVSTFFVYHAGKWRRHIVEFKRQVVERMKTCENIGALARELDLDRKLYVGQALSPATRYVSTAEGFPVENRRKMQKLQQPVFRRLGPAWRQV